TRWPRDWSSDVCSSDLGRLADAVQAARKQDQLPGEEEAEEEGREEAAEDEVPPVGSRAPLHMLCDSGGGHSRRKGNRGVRPERVQKAFCLIELTCLGPMSTILVRERTR